MVFPLTIETPSKFYELNFLVLCQPRWDDSRQEVVKAWSCHSGLLNTWLQDSCKLEACKSCTSDRDSRWSSASPCDHRARFPGSILIVCKLILAHFFQWEFNPLALFWELDEAGWIFFTCGQLLLDCIVAFFNKIVNDDLFAMIELSNKTLKFGPKIVDILIALLMNTIFSTRWLFLIKIAKIGSQSLKHLIDRCKRPCGIFSKARF